SSAPGAAGVPFLTAGAAGAPPQLRAWRIADNSTRRIAAPVAFGGPFVWSPDGKVVAFSGAAVDGVHRDVVAFEPGRTQEARLLVAAGAKSWRVLDWSADGARLLLVNEANSLQ